MKKIAIFALLFLISSCEKELNVTLPYAEDNLVLLSILSPTRPVLIKIERTYPPTGTITFDDKYLATVTGELFEDGKEIAKIKQSSGVNFILNQNIKIVQGKAYYFKVRATGFKEAISLPTVIPPPPSIKDFNFGEDVVSPLNEKIPSKKLSFFIEDNKSTKNFYSVAILSYFNDQSVANQTPYLGMTDGVKNKCFTTGANNDGLGVSWEFDGSCFSGQTKRLDFAIELEGSVQSENFAELPPSEWLNKRIKSFKVRIKNVPGVYFQYQTTGVVDLTFLQAFSPIKPRISNIKNGFGLVAGINEVVFDVKL